MHKFSIIFLATLLPIISACDLQPKITNLPDSVGDFISARYPTLLADPDAQPDIYNSAASDYGVYSSPSIYGGTGNTNDYILYSDKSDYIAPAQDEDISMYGVPPDDSVPSTDNTKDYADDEAESTQVTEVEYLSVPMYGNTQINHGTSEVTVARGDTLYSLAQRYGSTTDELARLNGLSAPYALSVGQKLKVPTETEKVIDKPVSTTVVAKTVSKTVPTTVALQEITVGPGDTLYSLSRQYSIPVNDLAVMNNISAPFTLSVGQKLRVPKSSLKSVKTVSDEKRAATVKQAPATPQLVKTAPQTNVSAKPVADTPKTKISSDPSKKLPSISARSASKFSWPVRGKILSHYGAKSGGLFNDGINIGASRGTTVGAAENGVVAYAGNEVKGMGNLIIVQHSGGWMTVYAHMDSMVVRRGAKVSVGQKIGTVGQTGKVDAPQLHFEIRKGTKAYNPSSYLK